MVFSIQRRFIAGAVCPRCKKQDVIVVFHENTGDWRSCVACGNKEALIHQEDRDNKTNDTIPVQNLDPPKS